MTAPIAQPVDNDPANDVANFFSSTSDIDAVRTSVEALLAEIANSDNEDEAQEALTALRDGVAAAGTSLEKSRLEREVAAEKQALTDAQNALIEKEKRLAELSPPAPKRGRRTKAQKEADDAAEAAEKKGDAK